MISKEKKIQILKNKIKFCEEKNNHKKIKEKLSFNIFLILKIRN